MPRIAHLTTVHHPSDPRIFRKQLQTLAEAGFEAHLIAPHTQPEMRSGVHLTSLPPARGRYRRVLLHPKLYRAARRLDAALYHFHDPELIPVAWLLGRTTGARIVYDMHENYRWHGTVEGRLLRVLERWCFRWVDHVVLSDAAYVEITDASRVPTTLVANYLKPPASLARNTGPVGSSFRLICTGVLSSRRGLFTLIDLADRAGQAGRDWRVDLTGVCYIAADRRRAEQQLCDRELGAVVERMGWDRYVPWRTLMRRTARSHVGLTLSLPNPNAECVIPTKFYEYMHYGLPILCSDFPLWRQFIEKHDCGATVPPSDAEAAFSVLEQWADDPALYRWLSENARAAARHYQWPVMGRRLVRLYNRLLGTSRSAPEGGEHPTPPVSG